MSTLLLTRLPLVAALAMSFTACSGTTPKDGTGGTDTVAGDTSGDETEILFEDKDKDGIVDAHEGTEDADGDGTPNDEDTDSDGDGILDKYEAGDDKQDTLPYDSDGDGVADYLDSDSDNNCVDDEDEGGDEGHRDTDGDGVYDFADTDNDGDGILDVDEIGDECDAPDSDGDGVANYMDKDSDGDGIGDVYEAGNTEFDSDPVDTDEDGTPDYLDDDSDDDGTSDADEGGVGSVSDEPNDTDGDGHYDFADTDSDGDALDDAEENSEYHTDPYDPDSDGDGFSDGGEVTADTDPLDPDSVIDGIYVEVPERTTTEELFEFELRIQMGDVGFIVDTTCSMSGTANAMASEYSAMVSTLADALPDAQYGFATHDDYPFASYGSPGSDHAFYLWQQVTDDVRAMQSALSATAIHSGADGPESSTEGLYQGLTGAGYDQSCDGSFSSTLDILPFLASVSDPFGGTGGQAYDPSDDSTGLLGGFGFREYALPIIVLATDNYMRDPESDNSSYNGTPGGCPKDAGMSDVVSGALGLGAYLVNISVNGSLPYPQMMQLAADTESYADTDGDGAADDELVFIWSGTSTEFRETVTGAIEDLVSAIRFHTLKLEVEGDEWGFVTGIDPEYIDIEGSVEGEVVDFTLTFRGVVAATTEDQLFKLTLNVLGDDTTLLDTMDIIVVVPGNSY